MNGLHSQIKVIPDCASNLEEVDLLCHEVYLWSLADQLVNSLLDSLPLGSTITNNCATWIRDLNVPSNSVLNKVKRRC